MKKAMSGFDLRVMARELDALKGAYVKKAYRPQYEQIVLRVNPKEADQRDIVFVRGARIYTSQRDRPMPMTPPPFAMVLRKHLRNARLTGVRQVGFDRVLAFSFDTKNGERTLYVEVFRDGNIILVDQEGVIIQPLTHASYAGRTLKKGVEYTPPPPAMDPYQLDEAALQTLNMAPMFLNQMAKPLLFLDFFRKACQCLFLLRLTALQTLHFSRLSPPRSGLLKSLLFSSLRSTSPILRRKKPMQPSFTQPFRRCYLNLMTATRAISFSNYKRMMPTLGAPSMRD